MIFRSTRCVSIGYSFFDVLLKGMPVDRGLFIFDKVPVIKLFRLLTLTSYHSFFYYIFKRFLSTTERTVLDFSVIAERVYSARNFYYYSYFHDVLAVKRFSLGGVKFFMLDLTAGKTFSFKDFAIAFLADLLNSYLLSIKSTINVLVATSGDTGSSCEYFLKSSSCINVFCFSPANLISYFQALQMYTINCNNIFNLKLQGSFDNCQRVLKLLLSANRSCTTLNSVNLIRVLAQSVYYFRCYYYLINYYNIKGNIVISVPTGNFGNVYSVYLAYKMGLPIRKLILVNNENDFCYTVFNSYLLSCKTFLSTNSPSMDVLAPSNLERYFYFKLDSLSFYNYLMFLSSYCRTHVYFSNYSLFAYRCCLYERKFLCRAFEFSGFLLDPHTANAVSYILKVSILPNYPIVCVVTAKYFKFFDRSPLSQPVFKQYKVIRFLESRRPKTYFFNVKDFTKIVGFVTLNML
ncbi:hypothetical protein JSR02_00525 [Candidatus Vidania fulgoroideae]|uniref:Threonine synthase n=1 Tax=Candidatus Vidania fulgoroideorum TaxID=881286 RepID=A0A974XDL4_9PROT|nr:hypothetical protein JSR02_00525 [Candidatus Vidania fulgoroideae]